MRKKGMTPKTAEKVRVKRGIDRGTKLRRKRVERGLSQSELAYLSGVPLKTLQRYEQNASAINGAKLNTLCSLCLALECKIENIIESDSLIEKYRLTK